MPGATPRALKVFLHPLGLLALLAVPGVLALHLFRRRFRPWTASAVFLWEPVDRVPVAGRRRERLLKSPSLWLEVLAALALALAFAGPRGACAPGRAEHLVCVLDDSASMSAVDRGAAVSDRARERVAERVRGLPAGSRVTLVASGPRPRLLAGPAAFPGEALDALDGWRPGAARHDLAPAIAFGERLAGDGAVLVVTDHFAPEAAPPSVELVSVGARAENVGIVNAVRERAGAGDRVFLTLQSFAGARRTATLELRAGSQVARRVLELEPAARVHAAFDVAEPDADVEASILEADSLAVDDRAYLAPVRPRPIRLHGALDDAEAAALGLRDGRSAIGRWLDIVPASREAGSAATADLVVARGPVAGPAWALEVVSGAGEERRDLIGPFLVEKRHPLLAGLTLEGVVWSASPDVVLEGAPLVSAGNDPLLVERREGERVVWRLDLDPARSSLQRGPDWPILLANLAELRRRELPGPERTNVAVGDSLVWRPGAERGGVEPDAALVYTLEGPEREREVSAKGVLRVDDVRGPGLYSLRHRGDELARFAVTFVDAGESDLRGALPGRREADRSSGEVRAGAPPAESLLVGLALALLVADWIVLARLGGGRVRRAGPGGAA